MARVLYLLTCSVPDQELTAAHSRRLCDNLAIFTAIRFFSKGAAECTFEVGQGSTLTVLLDERLYKHAKAAAAKEAERFYEEERRLSPWGRRRGREAALSDEAGPLYNRHCSVLLEQFVKTQMLSQFLSEGTWL